MEKVNFSSNNLAKLDVSKGENITELYIQNNRLEEIDLLQNKKIEILECTDNPLRYIKGYVPLSAGKDFLILEAGKGGSVGLKYNPQEGQQYFAYPDDEHDFDGWYNILGDRISREIIWTDSYGTGREMFAMFREK